MGTSRLRLAVCLLAAAAACQKNNSSEKLAALDDAYRSGLLTKQEYDVKRAALAGSAAPTAGGTPAPSSGSDTKPSPLATDSVPAPPPARPQAAEPEERAPAPLPGCNDLEYKTSKEKGPEQRFYPYPVARVHKAAAAALGSLEFVIHKDGNNEIEASKKRHVGLILHGGERFLLRFRDYKQNGQKGTLVMGETKKNIVGRLGQKTWTDAVLAQTACELRR